MKAFLLRHRGKLLLTLVVVVGLGMALKNKLAPPPIEFMTVPVEKADVRETVLATGSLEGRKQVSVGARVSGQLRHLLVQAGDKVKKGQLLAEIDPLLQQNDLRNAEAALDSVEAQKVAKLALQKQYQLALKRQQAMRRDDASAQADLETAQASLAQTNAELRQLDAQIRQAKITVDTAKVNLGYTQITAPMDGVVIAIVTEEGQTVVAAQSAPTILKLADLDTMTVKAQISEADVIRVQPGQAAEFTVLGAPQKVFKGKLRAIDPAPESESDSTSSSSTSSSSTSSTTAIYYNALFDVPNPDNTLRVSMTAQVTIQLGESLNALTIPLSVLGRETGENRYEVMLLDHDHPVQREITTGRKDSVRIEVLQGLAEGDRLIIGDSKTADALQASKEKEHRGPPPRG